MKRTSIPSSVPALPCCRPRRLGRGFRVASGLAFAAALTSPAARASVTLANGDPQDDFNVAVLANGLSQPTDVAELPDGRVVITQRLGDVIVVEADGMTQTEAGHINVDPEFQEQGLDGVVADPDFATNNTLYFFASADSNIANKNKVYKITLGTDSMLAAGRMAIVDQGLLGPLNHNGGGLAIHDGKLFVAVGDTGHNATPPTNRLGTCLNSPNGKILRVNLDGSIPSDNPLSSLTEVTGCVSDDGCANDWAGSCGAWTQPLTMQPPDKRVYFWGMRNPYRFWIDPQTTRMWIGDVGETTREEVTVSAPLNGAVAAAGQHFGWPFREGTTNYTTQQESYQPAGACMGITPARECIGPVYDYPHSNGNNCVIGGVIPDGCGWAEPWNQRYFFGDNGSGNVWTLDVNEARDGVVADSRKDFADSSGIASFHMGKKGVLYFVEAGGGVVTKVTPKALDPDVCTPVSSGGAGGMSSGGAAGTGNGGAGTGGNSAGGADDGGMSAGGTAGTGTSGAGGTGTSGTGTGTGGSGTAGMSSGGKGGTGSGTGGKGGAAPGTGGTGTGGTTPATGGTATAGTGTGGATAPGGTDEDSGCGCRVAGSESNLGGLAAAIGGLALMRLRSRLSRRRKAG